MDAHTWARETEATARRLYAVLRRIDPQAAIQASDIAYAAGKLTRRPSLYGLTVESGDDLDGRMLAEHAEAGARQAA